MADDPDTQTATEDTVQGAVETPWKPPFPVDHLPPHSEEAELQKQANIAQPLTILQRLEALERHIFGGPGNVPAPTAADDATAS